MASGDVVLTVTAAPITGDDVAKSGNVSVQTTTFGLTSSTTTSTPNGSEFQSAQIVLQKNTGTASIETPFDASKTYKITVTEV